MASDRGAGGGQHLDFDSQSSGVSADGSGYNLNIGGSYRLNEAWRVGVAAGFYRQKLEAGDQRLGLQAQQLHGYRICPVPAESLVG